MLKSNIGVQVVEIQNVRTLLSARKNAQATRGIDSAVVRAVDNRSTALEQLLAVLVMVGSLNIFRASDADAVSVFSALATRFSMEV